MIIHNDIQGFNTLYNESYTSFLQFAFGYVRDIHVAEDFVSEAFTTYWENKNTLESNTIPKAYILTVLRNKCLNHLQHMQVRQRVKNEISEHSDWLLNVSINTLEACNPENIFSDEIQKIVKETIEQLPEKTKQAYALSRTRHLSNKEIAKQMNLSVKSVEYHISKALSQLRIALKDFIYIIPFLYFIL